VEQVATYFAVNMLMAHWDGYFNNYFAYHDAHGTGKWTVYPWDQDKAMGFHDAIRPGEVFTTMPLTYGMKGDLPPGWNRPYAPRSFMDVINVPGMTWWRLPGYFSGPLLANPKFRAVFLGRIKELLNTEFSEAKMTGIINGLDPLLREEVRTRAKSRGEDPRGPEAEFDANMDSLRRFVAGRREYLLKQPELQKAGPVDRSQL
jgi:hypothetical protein